MRNGAPTFVLGVQLTSKYTGSGLAAGTDVLPTAERTEVATRPFVSSGPSASGHSRTTAGRPRLTPSAQLQTQRVSRCFICYVVSAHVDGRVDERVKKSR